MWSIDDLAIRAAVRFVAEGEPLPEAPGWHLHPCEHDQETGIPAAMRACREDHVTTVREMLARDADAAGG